MRKSATGKPHAAAVPMPDLQTPMFALAPEDRTLLAQVLTETRDLRRELARSTAAPLTPEMLAEIEYRAMVRVTPLLTLVVKRSTEAAEASQKLLSRIEGAGDKLQRSMANIIVTARAGARTLRSETQTDLAKLHGEATKKFQRTQREAENWARRLTRFTRQRMLMAAREAAAELAATTTEGLALSAKITRIAASVETAAEAIVDMVPTTGQDVEILVRSASRSTGLIMLAGLAFMIAVVSAGLWWRSGGAL